MNSLNQGNLQWRSAWPVQHPSQTVSIDALLMSLPPSEAESEWLLQRQAIACVFKYLRESIPAPLFDSLISTLHASGNLPDRVSWDGTRCAFSFDDSANPAFLWKALQEYCGFKRQSTGMKYNGMFALTGSPMEAAPSSPRTANLHLSHARYLQETNVRSPAILPQLFINTYLATRFQLVKILVGHNSPCFCVTFDRTERRIISGSDDGNVKIWCSATGLLIYALRGHTAPVSDVSCSPDNRIVASASLDCGIRFWELGSGRHLRVVSVDSAVQSVQFHPILDSESGYGLVCASSGDGFIYLWRYRIKVGPEGEVAEFSLDSEARKVICKSTSKQEIRCCTFTQGGTRLIVGGTDGLVRLISAEIPRSVLTCKNIDAPIANYVVLEGHDGHVTSVHCSYRGCRFVTGSWDGTAIIWSFSQEALSWQQQQLPVYKDGPLYQANPEANQRNRVLLVLWSFDDTKIITSSNDFVIRVWSVADGALLYRMSLHSDEVYILATHPKIENLFISAGWDGRIGFWDISTGALIASFTNEGRRFNDGQFNNDGTLFALVDNQGAVLVYAIGVGSDSYSTAPTEQFLRLDFNRIVFDEHDFPLDSVTMLQPHLVPRTGIFSVLGVPNVSVDVNFGVNVPVLPSELDVQIERCEIETLNRNERELFRLEKRNPMLKEELEQLLRRRKRVRFGAQVSASEGEQQATIDEDLMVLSSTLDHYVERYATDSDDSYEESISESSRMSSSDEPLSESSSSSRFSETEDVPSRSRVARRQFLPESNETPTPPIAVELPLWMSATVTKSHCPFVPQVGDRVVYFRQGHGQFLELSPQYSSALQQNLPWEQHQFLDYVVFAQVSAIAYAVGPPRTTSIWLKQEERAGRLRRSAHQSTEFLVEYFDHSEMVDFVIDRDRYDVAIQKNSYIRPGSSVEVLFGDGCLYTGTIVSRQPYDPLVPESPWQTYRISWEDEDDDQNSLCSPWEVYTSRDRSDIAPMPGLLIPVSVLDAFSEIIERFPSFANAVDFDEYPEYTSVIAYPICLDLIHERLQNRYYRSIPQFRLETTLLVLNAKQFNCPGSKIFRDACKLGRDLEKLVDDFEDIAAVTDMTAKRNRTIIESSDESSAATGDEDCRLRRRSQNKRHRG